MLMDCFLENVSEPFGGVLIFIFPCGFVLCRKTAVSQCWSNLAIEEITLSDTKDLLVSFSVSSWIVSKISGLRFQDLRSQNDSSNGPTAGCNL